MFDPTAQEPDTPIVLRPSDFTLLAGAAVCAITVPTNRDGYPTGAALLLSMLVGPNSRHPGGHWHSYLLPELPDLPLAHFAGTKLVDDPLGHAATGTPKGNNVAALCGASVTRARRTIRDSDGQPVASTPSGAAFDPDHRRACPRCAKAVREANP